MSLKVEDWRLYVGSESWDNQLGTGTLKVLGINLDAGSPTEAKQIQIVVPDNAVSRTIVETDVVRLDMYSTEAAAWVTPFLGQVSSVEKSPDEAVLGFDCYDYLFQLTREELAETVINVRANQRRTGNAYNTDQVTLPNANQQVWTPLEACLMREPILFFDVWDQQTVVPITNNGGAPVQIADFVVALCGADYELDHVIIYVEDFTPASGSSVQLQVRGQSALGWAGGTVYATGNWPLNQPPIGPIVDRWGNQRFYIWFDFSANPVALNTEDWTWLRFELSVINTAAPFTLNICAFPGSQSSCSASGIHSGWGNANTGNYPGPGTPDQLLRQINCEIWAGNNWKSIPPGEIKEWEMGGKEYWKMTGYMVGTPNTPASLYTNTPVVFPKKLDGSIECAILNYDIYYQQGWASLTDLLTYLMDGYCMPPFNSRNIAGVTNDMDWPDPKTKYTNLYAALKGVCDRTDLTLECRYVAPNPVIHSEDRAVIAAAWAAYNATEQARRTFMNGADDTSARKVYSKLNHLRRKTSNFRSRDVWITVFDSPYDQPANIGCPAGGVAEWDALCAAAGLFNKGIVGEVFAQGVDNQAIPADDAYTMLERVQKTYEEADDEVEAVVSDLDPIILSQANQVLSFTDTPAGLAAKKYLLRGYTFGYSGRSYGIRLMMEQQIKWRGPTELFRTPTVGAAAVSLLDGEKATGTETNPIPRIGLSPGGGGLVCEGSGAGPPAQAPKYDVKSMFLAYPISWAGASCTRNVNTITKIAIGNSSATNNLCAMDNIVAKKTCVIRDVAGKGKLFLASFYFDDWDTAAGGNLIVQEVALLDAADNVIYRRALKQNVAGWYNLPHASMTQRTRLAICIAIQD